METNTNRKKKMYAPSNVFTTMEAVVDGQMRTLRSDIGFLMVFKTRREAQVHLTSGGVILEIIVS